MCLFNIGHKDFNFIARLSCGITNSLISCVNGGIKVTENKTGFGQGSESKRVSMRACVLRYDLGFDLKKS